MTNQSDLQLLGDEVDTTIASITKNPKTAVHGTEGSALGSVWDAALAAAKPPVTKTLVGSSPGDPGITYVEQTVGPLPISRAFNVAQAAALPVGTRICFSQDSVSRGYELAVPNPAAAIAAEVALLRKTLKDTTVPHYRVWGHEEDIHGNDLNRLRLVYKNGEIAIAEVNADRPANAQIMSCSASTGMPYGSTAYQAWDFGQVLGMDNYSRSHWAQMLQHGKDLGRPVCAPEWGIKSGAGSPSEFSLQEHMDCIQKDPLAFSGALFMIYFFGLRCDLSKTAQGNVSLAPARSALKSLIASSKG